MSEPTEGPYISRKIRRDTLGVFRQSTAEEEDREDYNPERLATLEKGFLWDRPLSEVEANARLLAASWEMLQVCRELDGLKWCASWEGDGENETIITRALGMARAVLAKLEPEGEDA